MKCSQNIINPKTIIYCIDIFIVYYVQMCMRLIERNVFQTKNV